MENVQSLDFRVSEDDEGVSYLRLPEHPGTAPGVVTRSANLRDLIGDYGGPDITFDFAENNVLIGIEIVA